jgi:hypothetical protein
MQSTQKLSRVLRDLVALIEEEAARNPAFAKGLDAIISGLPETAAKAKKPKSTPSEPSPDVIAVFQEKGEEEFRFCNSLSPRGAEEGSHRYRHPHSTVKKLSKCGLCHRRFPG